MSNDREKALDVALAAIDKQFGKGSIMRMGEKTSMGIESIQTGALSPRPRPRRRRLAAWSRGRDLRAGVLG